MELEAAHENLPEAKVESAWEDCAAFGCVVVADETKQRLKSINEDPWGQQRSEAQACENGRYHILKRS